MAEADGAPSPDLAEVLADDALVEAIGKGEISASDAPDDVVALLVAWRDDIDHRSVPDRPTLDEATRALQAAPRRSWRLTRRAVAPLAAASVVGLALVGIGVAAHQSTPGDPLWGVSQTLFVAHSRSVQAAVSVSADLSQAQVALAAGSAQQAMASLDEAKRQLPDVGSSEGRQALEQKHAELVAQVGARLAKPSKAPTTPVPSPAPEAGSTGTNAAPSDQPSPDTSVAATGSPETGVAATTTPPSATGDAPSSSSAAPTTSSAPTSSAAPTTSGAPPTTSGAPPTSAAPTTGAGPKTSAGANPAPTSASGSPGVPTVAPVGMVTGAVGDPLSVVRPI